MHICSPYYNIGYFIRIISLIRKRVEHYAKVNYVYDTIPHEGIPVRGLLYTPEEGEEITVLIHPKKKCEYFNM